MPKIKLKKKKCNEAEREGKIFYLFFLTLSPSVKWSSHIVLPVSTPKENIEPSDQ